MKNVEMMENDPKAAALPSENTASGNPGAASEADQRRRRFVRGAAVAAPLVLTLRSGALAAASCVGGGLPRVETLLPNGEIPGTATSTDRCFESVRTCTVNSNKIDGGTPLLDPTVSPVSPLPQLGSGFKCNGGTVGQQVAILSSSSAASLGVS